MNIKEATNHIKNTVIAYLEKLPVISIESTPMLTNMVEHTIFRTSDLVHFSGHSAFKYHGVHIASTTKHNPNTIHKAINFPHRIIIYYIVPQAQ